MKRVLVVDSETVEFQIIPKLQPVLVATPKEPFRPKKTTPLIPEWILVGNSPTRSAALQSPPSRNAIQSYTYEELAELWRWKSGGGE